MRPSPLGLALATACLTAGCSDSPTGSDTLQCSVPGVLIFDTGVGRSGIPALDLPDVEIASDADFMDDTMRVLGMEIAGQARAYPLFILWWHEVANDTLGGENIVVSYCPLTGSGLAFDANVEGDLRTFEVSGLLFENNLVMVDSQTHSFWN